MEDKFLPSSRTAVHVNTSGARIVEADEPKASPSGLSLSLSAESGSRDSSDIYLPKHTEWISHIALDIGGSLAKVVYFSRAPKNGNHHHLLNGNGNGNGNGKGKAREEGPSSGAATATGQGEAGQQAGAAGPSIQNSPRLMRFDLDGISSGLNNNKTASSTGCSRPASPGRTTPVPNGVLGPDSIASASALSSYFDKRSANKASGRRTSVHDSSDGQHHHPSSTSASTDAASAPSASATTARQSRPRPAARHARRSSSLAPIPGGWLNFTKFETGDMESCIEFLNQLIESSASSHGIPSGEFKARHVKIMATGGGAHLFYDVLSEELGVEVRKEEEMECLITGLTFFMEIPHEVFWYSDQLIDTISHPGAAHTPLPSSLIPPSPLNGNIDLPRPSPNPPQYALVFDENPTPQFPCMLVNIGSGVSIIKVDDYGKYERISGTSLGGGTLWGLLSLLTGASSFDEMLALSEQGDNANVDMLVGDIYGSDYSKIGLKSSTIASSFGKVFRKGGNQGKTFKPEDISKSLLYAISNNIGQIAYMNAEKHNLDRIYFGGCFIRGHAATISTLSYAIRFWSKGTKKALFLRHEGYLGSIGAWLRNIEEEDTRR